MSKYRHLFFDLDHTLWDFEANSIATLQSLYNEMTLGAKGIADFDDFNTVYHEINNKLWDRFRKGLLSREDLRWKRMWKTLVHYRINDEKLAKDMSERYLEILPTQTLVFPHCIELMEYCVSKNYAMHLITNGFELTQKLKLKNAQLDSYFDKIITSEQAMSMKPQKEIFEFALRETGALVAESLMIGDALDIDVLGAQLVGMDQVYFNPKQIAHEGNPTFEIESLHEMYHIV
jgi:putative hydrolase of the HAD superfamily